MADPKKFRASALAKIGCYHGRRFFFCNSKTEAEEWAAKLSGVSDFKLEPVEKTAVKNKVDGAPFVLDRRSTSYKKGIHKQFAKQAESGKIRT